MNEHMRDRLILPIAIPVGILVAIGAITFGVSRVLLNVPNAIAIAVALMIAVSIMAAGSFISLRPNLRPVDFGVMFAVAVVPLVIGAAVAVGVVPVESASDEHGGPEHETPEAVEVVAVNTAFNVKELKVPAEQPFDLELDNKDTVPHNVSIYKQQGGETLFKGEIFSGPAVKVGKVKALPVGSYYFQCDVHPNMNGTAVAQTTETGPGKETTGGESQKIVARSLKFDKAELRFTAEKPGKLEFDNAEAQPHNVSIYKQQGGEAFFKETTFITGPNKKVVYNIPAMPAGSYYFQCDVHPNMNGKVLVT